MSVRTAVFVLLTAVMFNLSTASPPIPLTSELLSNGSFEAESNGWQKKFTDVLKSDKVKCDSAEKIVAHAGECAFMFRGNPGGTKSKLRQTVSDTSAVTSGAEMTFSAYIDPRSADAGATIGKAVVKFSDGGKLTLMLAMPAAGAGYTLVTDTETVSSAAAVEKVQVILQYGGSSGKFYVDDVSLTVSASGETPTPEITVTPPAGWTLVWSDEFNGSQIDPANWVFDIGTGSGGWGNNELEYYTDRPENARIENGMLVIEARKEAYEGSEYTSARLKTQGLQAWTYGRIEARIQIPYGQGIWPAFWMLGTNITEVSWPQCGEIDIMENIGSEPYTVHGTVHGPGYSGGDGVGSSVSLDVPFSEGFHLFAVEWSATEIRWYLDGGLYLTVTTEDVPGAWVFDHDFFLLLNVAVGGNWPGSPDSTTIFPQQMKVDYVRVYQQ
jgi:beta-glucanase (GH16 family)